MDRLETQLIAEYTENNYHTEVAMLSAIRAERFDLLKELSEIALRHRENGYITKEDQERRDHITKEAAYNKEKLRAAAKKLSYKAAYVNMGHYYPKFERIEE